jgi:hypothetical protein
MTTAQRIRRTGLFLALFLLGMIIYSFIVISTRGRLKVSANPAPQAGSPR